MPIIVVTKTNWIVRPSSGTMTCRMVCARPAPSTRAASRSDWSSVENPAMKITSAMPKVAQMCTPMTVNMAIFESPSQSTGPMRACPRSRFSGPSTESSMLKIAPMMTGESTTGKK